jgi:hypothetical protein
MDKYIMNQTNNNTKPEEQGTKTPDENAGVLLQGKIKISDPVTGKVFVNQRA